MLDLHNPLYLLNIADIDQQQEIDGYCMKILELLLKSSALLLICIQLWSRLGLSGIYCRIALGSGKSILGVLSLDEPSRKSRSKVQTQVT